MTRLSSPTPTHKAATLFPDGAFPFRMLGFGLLYAWSSCVWDVPALDLAGGTRTLTGGGLWLASAVLTPLAFLAFALVGRTRDLSGMRGLCATGTILTCGGTIAAAAALGLSGPAGTVAAVLAAIGTGIGPALLIMLWLGLFTRIDAGIVETVVPTSFAATLVCLFVVPALSGAASVVVVAALPALSSAMFAASRQLVDEGRIAPCERPATSSPHEEARAGAVARMVVVVFSLYAVACIVPCASTIELSAADESRNAMVGMLFAIALAVAAVLFARRIDLGAVLRWMSLPFVAAVLCTALQTEASAQLASVFTNIVFTCIEIIMILYFVRLAGLGERPAPFYIGLGEGAAYAGVLVGEELGIAVREAVGSGTLEAHMACLIALSVFIVTTLVVPGRASTWMPAIAGPVGAAGSNPQGTQAEASLCTPAADRTPAPNVAAAAEDCVRQQPTPPAALAPDPAAAFDERVLAVARRGGLTARETEVFRLLARGRSRPYIRDALVLSKNTVATHIRHIYEKLGVHSQQEVIDLVEREQ